MEVSNDTVNQEVQLAGSMKFVQFTSSLNTFIENEILSEGWQGSVDEVEKSIPKAKYLAGFNKALHNAILSGFDDSLKEMLAPVDLPKKWDLLYQTNDGLAETRKRRLRSSSKNSLLNVKLKHKNILESIINMKMRKIIEIRQRLNVCKLTLTRKLSEIEYITELYNKNRDRLEELSYMRF